MKEIDRLIRRARKIVSAVVNVIFIHNGKCTKCHKPIIEQCSCRNKLADERIIEFVRCRSREEANEWMKRKESD